MSASVSLGTSSSSSSVAATAGGDMYCTSYPPPDMEDNTSSSGKSLLPAPSTSIAVSVDYSHGRRKDTITSESILASLQTDIVTTPSSAYNNGSNMSNQPFSNANIPLKDKVKGFTQHIRNEIGSRPVNPHAAGNQGNGFIPRQLKGNRMPTNVGNRPSSGLLGAAPMVGPRPGLHKNQPHPHRPSQPRKW